MQNKGPKRTHGDFRGRKLFLSFEVTILLVLILTLSLVGVPAGSAQEGAPFLWQVQTFESDRTGLSNPVGLAFSSRANAFQVAEGRGPSQTIDFVRLTPFADRAAEARIAAAVENAINIAYDNQLGRLLILRGNGNQLWEVREGPDGNLDPRTLTHYNVKDLDLQDPQGLTVDLSGALYILDAAAPRILRVQPGTGRAPCRS